MELILIEFKKYSILQAIHCYSWHVVCQVENKNSYYFSWKYLIKFLGALKIGFPILFYVNHLERGCYILYGSAKLLTDYCHVKMTVH